MENQSTQVAHEACGHRIKIYWESDNRYFSGTCVSYSSRRGHLVEYDPVEGEDDMTRWHTLAEERWAFEGAGPKKPPPPKRKADSSAKPKASSQLPPQPKRKADSPALKPKASHAPKKQARGGAGKSAQDAVDLCSDDDGEPSAPPQSAAPTASITAPASSAAEEAAEVGVGAVARPLKTVTATVETSGGDDDVECLGHAGTIALVDFPHARYNCALNPFTSGNERAICANCYCYVCDVPASSCKAWTAHCKATNASDMWRREREIARKAALAPKPAAPAPAPAASTSVSTYVAPAPVERWSCDELLKATEQVYPVETPEPAGLADGIVLRPYQKQSLAFMIDVERSTDPSLAGDCGFRRGGWLADEVGMGKTAVVTALVLANPRDVKPISNAAFARLHDEAYNTPTLEFKATIVVVNNTLVKQWADEIGKFAPGLNVHVYYGERQLKERALRELRECDVLLTTPHMISKNNISDAMLTNMKVHRLVVDEAHMLSDGSSTQSKLGMLRRIKARNVWCVSGTPFSTSLGQLQKQAILLGMFESFDGIDKSTTTNERIVEWLRARMIRHTKGMRIGGEVALALPEKDCKTVWLEMSDDERLIYGVHECVGGHVLKLTDQARFEAAAHIYSQEVVSGNAHAPYGSSYSVDSPSSAGSFAAASAAYKRLHTTIKTPVKHTGPSWMAPAVQQYNVENRLNASATKFAALLADLQALREVEPDFRAVIFTRFDAVQAQLVGLLKRESKEAGGALYQGKAAALKVFEFSKKTQPQARHRRISEFQNGTSAGAKCFVVTVQTAAVGITLTAATRVFLMEPLPDPAQEVQAAGRIHRLGQTRDIFIKRYCFRDSIEAATVALHEKLRAGDFKICDGKFPEEAHDLFKAHGPAGALFKPRGEPQSKELEGEGLLDWQGATRPPRAKKGQKAPKLKPSTWARKCTEEECRLCGVCRISPGSSVWSGTGIFSYLNGPEWQTPGRDPPAFDQGAGPFRAVPAPPEGWQPERFGNSRVALLNTKAERAKVQDEIAAEEAEKEAEAEAEAEADDADYVNSDRDDVSEGDTDDLEDERDVVRRVRAQFVSNWDHHKGHLTCSLVGVSATKVKYALRSEYLLPRSDEEYSESEYPMPEEPAESDASDEEGEEGDDEEEAEERAYDEWLSGTIDMLDAELQADEQGHSMTTRRAESEFYEYDADGEARAPTSASRRHQGNDVARYKSAPGSAGYGNYRYYSDDDGSCLSDCSSYMSYDDYGHRCY